MKTRTCSICLTAALLIVSATPSFSAGNRATGNIETSVPLLETEGPQHAALALPRAQIALRADGRVVLGVGKDYGYGVGDRLKVFEKVKRIDRTGRFVTYHKLLGEVLLLTVASRHSEASIEKNISFSDLSAPSDRPIAMK